MTSLSKRLPRGPQPLYRSAEFKLLIENHLPYLTSIDGTTLAPLEPMDMLVYRGNLYGYLRHKNVNPNHFWTIMRINGWHTPSEFTDPVHTIIMPNIAAIDELAIKIR